VGNFTGISLQEGILAVKTVEHGRVLPNGNPRPQRQDNMAVTYLHIGSMVTEYFCLQLPNSFICCE
jgi:hypothetical protein